jgi:uncharacterized protein YneF (UPF0154 family)
MNNKPTFIAIHCTVAGAILGGILDTGMGMLLPCEPWPTPLGTGYGFVIGAAAGGLGFALIRAGMTIGGYAALKNQTIHRLIHTATLFIVVCSIMGGVIGAFVVQIVTNVIEHLARRPPVTEADIKKLLLRDKDP